MSGTRHPVWDLLDKLQMDNRAQAAKLVELRAAFAAMALPEKDPPLPMLEQISRQIANGVLADRVDLDAELAAHPSIVETERVALIALLEAKEQVA